MKWNSYNYIENKQHLGLALKSLRKEHNVKQKDLAKSLGIDVKTLRKIEQGKEDYSIDNTLHDFTFFLRNVCQDFALLISMIH